MLDLSHAIICETKRRPVCPELKIFRFWFFFLSCSLGSIAEIFQTPILKHSYFNFHERPPIKKWLLKCGLLNIMNALQKDRIVNKKQCENGNFKLKNKYRISEDPR